MHGIRDTIYNRVLNPGTYRLVSMLMVCVGPSRVQPPWLRLNFRSVSNARF